MKAIKFIIRIIAAIVLCNTNVVVELAPAAEPLPLWWKYRLGEQKPEAYWYSYNRYRTDPRTIDRYIAELESLARSTSTDLRDQFPSVRDQGNQNSCAAIGVADFVGHFFFKKNAWRRPVRMSPAFIYNQRNGGIDNGLNLPRTLDFAVSRGCPPEKMMPYDETDYLSRPTSEDKAVAQVFRLPGYITVWDRDSGLKDIESVKKALANGKSLIISMVIPGNFRDYNGKYVWAHHYSSALGSRFGYGLHAMLVVGYDDSRGENGAFLCRNSWGKDWGDEGHCWIDYTTFERGVTFGATFSVDAE